MSTRAITTSTDISTCDICGRNLLRGERAETYINGAERHTVCDLCTARAIHGGWLREGELPDYGDGNARVDRRRSLLSRLRSRRDGHRRLEPEPEPEPYYGDGFEQFSQEEPAPPVDPPVRSGPSPRPVPASPPPAPVRANASRADRPRQREPRHVRAVPTSSEHKILSAVEIFNGSEHPRTVAGISRSLGLPEVSVLASPTQLSVVNIVVAWELCWYRYEVELSDEVPGVRLAGQGYELNELAAEERQANATADEAGTLSVTESS